MTSVVKAVKDTRGHVTKYVPDSTNPNLVSEVWMENEGGGFEKVRSYTYYPASQDPYESRKTGLVHTETVYNVASYGTSRDMVNTYTYTFYGDSSGDQDNNADQGYSTIVTDSAGKQRKSHYNKLGQLVWERDECGRVTNYTYEYRGNLIETRFPAVVYDGEGEADRKTISNQYSQCCGQLEWTKDERNKKTYYSYDGNGRMVKSWTDIQNPTQQYPVPVGIDPLVESRRSGR